MSGGTHLQIDRVDHDRLREIALEEQRRVRDLRPAAVVAVDPQLGAPATATEPLGTNSAVYVHPVEIMRGNRRLLYLDYWWYLLDNPADTGGGALCGAGLVIAGSHVPQPRVRLGGPHGRRRPHRGATEADRRAVRAA